MLRCGGLAKTAQLPYASSLCGACREVCPVKIDIPQLLLHLRAEVVEGTAPGTSAQQRPVNRKLAERLVFRLYAFAWSSPTLYEWGMRIGRLLQRFAVRDGRIGKVSGFIARLAPPLAAWTNWRDALPLAPRSFRELWREQHEGEDPER